MNKRDAFQHALMQRIDGLPEDERIPALQGYIKDGTLDATTVAEAEPDPIRRAVAQRMDASGVRTVRELVIRETLWPSPETLETHQRWEREHDERALRDLVDRLGPDEARRGLERAITNWRRRQRRRGGA